MLIINHLLYHDENTPVTFIPTPNYYKWQKILFPEYLVMHYTAASSSQLAINWITNKSAMASTHLLIGKDGLVVQFIPFNNVAWHAGSSLWVNRTSLNRYSIGIELDNYGLLLKKVNGKWTRGNLSFEDAEVVEGPSKRGYSTYGWPKFPDIQREVALEVSRLIFQTYNLKDVVGHEDINTLGKVDPGPAFPLNQLRSYCLGVNEGDPISYLAYKKMYLRSGPDIYTPVVSYTPVYKGTEVQVLNRNRIWAYVRVANPPANTVALEGWALEQDLLRKMV
jgi:N-acetylmuramoyl-L-alanine amidase